MEAPLSPEALALALLPEGVITERTRDRAHWLALRERDVTASSAGALFGIHPYQTAFGLWGEKTGKIVEEVDDRPKIEGDVAIFPPIARGNLFEPPSVEALRLIRPEWRVAYPLGRYWSMTKARIGATPDVLAIDPARPGFGSVQMKTVAPQVFRETWRDKDTGEIVPPLWIALQALVEARLTGASWAAVAALIVDYDCRLVVKEIPISDRAWGGLVERVAAFWGQVKAGTTPDPDFLRDGALIMRLFAESDERASVDLSADARAAELVARREELKAIEAAGNVAEKDRKTVDAELIFKLGNAETGILPGGGVITAKTARRGGYEVKPTSYRSVKIKGGSFAAPAPTTRKTSAALSTAIPERF